MWHDTTDRDCTDSMTECAVISCRHAQSFHVDRITKRWCLVRIARCTSVRSSDVVRNENPCDSCRVCHAACLCCSELTLQATEVALHAAAHDDVADVLRFSLHGVDGRSYGSKALDFASNNVVVRGRRHEQRQAPTPTRSG